jgi:Immunity protein 32
MPDHLLTFELAKDGDELLIHADAGRKEHIHLMTKDWSGDELSSVAQDSEASLLHQVTIQGWPKGGARDDVT